MNTTSRIATILFIIFLMPVLFFSIYEINSLNKDEEMINQVYEKQLEAILFSANQYADDILNSWIVKLEISANQTQSDSVNTVNQLLSLNPAIEAISFYNLSNQRLILQHRLNSNLDSIRSDILNTYSSQDSLFSQLLKFEAQGYQKIEAIDLAKNQLTTLTFKPKNSLSDDLICGIIISPESFIDEVLGPRLQFIAQDRFAIIATTGSNSSPIYSTYDSADFVEINQVLTEDLWLLPDYKLGISTRGTSLNAIVEKRTQTDLILIIALTIVLIAAVIYTFRAVRKEIQLAQNKSEFIANVSHELRTPLALISMFAETLEMNRIKSQQKKEEYYSIIHKETQRLTGIVNKILSFSQLDAGKKQINYEPVDLSASVEQVLSTYEFHLDKNHFVLNKSLESGAIINADKDAIVEIVINLIDNAIKYSEGEKVLDISVKTNLQEVILTVKDYGVGISKDDQKLIFDKFYRSSTGDLAKKQGTGLGLALVKQLVDVHKAEIKLQSEINKGSSFSIHFKKHKHNA